MVIIFAIFWFLFLFFVFRLFIPIFLLDYFLRFLPIVSTLILTHFRILLPGSIQSGVLFSRCFKRVDCALCVITLVTTRFETS